MKYTEFKLAEALSNSQGKSSLGLLFALMYGIMSIVLGAIATYMVLKGLPLSNDVFVQSGLYGAASTSLLGIRRLTKDKDLIQENKENI